MLFGYLTERHPCVTCFIKNRFWKMGRGNILFSDEFTYQTLIKASFKLQNSLTLERTPCCQGLRLCKEELASSSGHVPTRAIGQASFTKILLCALQFVFPALTGGSECTHFTEEVFFPPVFSLQAHTISSTKLVRLPMSVWKGPLEDPVYLRVEVLWR